MTATITIGTQKVTTGNEEIVQAIREARARSDFGAKFRLRRPSPDGRKIVVRFTAADVVAINANGIDLTDLQAVPA